MSNYIVYATGFIYTGSAYYSAKWNGSAWSALGTPGLDGGGGNDICADPSGNIYTLGSITSASGNTVNSIAKWNGLRWFPLGSGLNSYNGLAVCSDNVGNIYATGIFTIAGGVSVSNIAKWSPVDSTWSALGTGLDDFGQRICSDQTGNIYVSGGFTHAGGSAVNYIAKWNGSAWSTLGTGLDHYCHDMCSAPNGDIYVTGNITTAGGNAVNYIAKWNGAAWSSLGSGLNGYGTSICAAPNGNIYVSGNFTSAGGISVNGIAMWDGSWHALGAGAAGTGLINNGSNVPAKDLCSDPDGNVYAVGDFTYAGGIEARHIAKWTPGTSTWSALGAGIYPLVPGMDITYSVCVGTEITLPILDLISPADQNFNTSTSTKLEWSPSSGATSYLVRVSNYTGSNLLWSGTVAAPLTECTVPMLFGGMAYSWNVTAINTAVVSPTWHFMTAADIVLLTPHNGSTDIALDDGFLWEEGIGATGYHLLVSTGGVPFFDQDVGIGTRLENNVTSYIVPGLLNGTEYTWKVATVNTNAQSETRSFTTSGVNLISPVNGTQIAVGTALTWDSSGVATSYFLQVNGASGLVFGQNIGNVKSYIVPGLENSAEYSWRVTAVNTSTTSQTWWFTTTAGAAPQHITLLSPNNGDEDISTTPEFTWEPSEGALGYHLEIRNGGAVVFDQPVGSLPHYTVPAYAPLASGTGYSWTVRATNTSSMSDVWTFTTVNASQTLVSLISPANGNYGAPSDSKLTWESSVGVTSYRLQVNGAGLIFDQDVGDVIEYTVPGLVAGVYYEWRVSAVNTSAVSATWSFMMALSDTEKPIIDIVSPTAWQVVSGSMVIQANVTDNVAIAGVMFNVDDMNVGIEMLNAPYSRSIDTTVLSNGGHTCSVVARDVAGNTETQDVQFMVDNSLNDTISPIIVISNPTDGQTIGGIFNVMVTITDNVAVNITSVDFLIDDVPDTVHVNVAEPLYTCLLDTNKITNGLHTLKITASDGVNVTIEQVSFTVSNSTEIDEEIPIVSLIRPTSGMTISGEFVLVATASDNVQVANVQFRINDEDIYPRSQIVPFSATLNTSQYPDGDYKISAIAEDAAGNRSIPSDAWISIDNTTVQAQPTEIQITASGVYYSINDSNFVLYNGVPFDVSAGDKVTAFTAMEFENYNGLVYSETVTVNYTALAQQNALFGLTNVNVCADKTMHRITISWDNPNPGTSRVKIYYGTAPGVYDGIGLSLSDGGTLLDSPIEVTGNIVHLYGTVSGIPYWIKVVPEDEINQEGPGHVIDNNVTLVNGNIHQVAKAIGAAKFTSVRVVRATKEISLTLG